VWASKQICTEEVYELTKDIGIGNIGFENVGIVLER